VDEVLPPVVVVEVPPLVAEVPPVIAALALVSPADVSVEVACAAESVVEVVPVGLFVDEVSAAKLSGDAVCEADESEEVSVAVVLGLWESSVDDVSDASVLSEEVPGPEAAL
jgi:hypothetical protein